MKQIDNTPIEDLNIDWGNPDGTGKKAKSLEQVQAFLKKKLNEGYKFISTATPSTTPVTLTGDEKVFYIATEEGDYANYGLGDINELSIIKSDKESWSAEGLGVPSNIDKRMWDKPFIGHGETLTFKHINLVAGRKYTLRIFNPLWKTDSIVDRPIFRVYHAVEGKTVIDYEVYVGNSVQELYEINTVECDFNNRYGVYIRADEGEEVVMRWDDVADNKMLFALVPNIEVIDSRTISFEKIYILRNNGKYKSISGDFNTYTFSKEETGLVLVVDENDKIEWRKESKVVLDSDTPLLAYSPADDKWVYGELLPLVNRLVTEKEISALELGVTKAIFSNTLKQINKNTVEFSNVNVYDNNGDAKVIWANKNHVVQTFEFVPVSNGGQGVALVISKEDSIVFRESINYVEPTDVVLLNYYPPNENFNSGELLPALTRVAFFYNVSNYSAYDAHNAHMSVMNKYAERFGMKNSTFMMPNGGSLVTARDMVKLLLAAIANAKMSTLWGIPTDRIVVYGNNARVDELHSSYMDETSYPKVADLKNFYHIFGGKSGGTDSNPHARNLVIVCKSNRDDAWLAGCVLYAQNDVEGNNRYSMMRDLFNALDAKRFKEEYSLESIDCEGAYAVVVPNNGNTVNYGFYDNLIDIGINEDSVIQSHSIAKLMTGLIAVDKLDLDEVIVFTKDDPYDGTSGSPYFEGDKLYCVDAIKSMMITSSSVATRALARYVGNKVLSQNNGVKMYSFRLSNATAYGEGSQTWMEWLSTPDYSRWSLNTGKVITCESPDNSVFIDGHETSLSCSDKIIPNSVY